MKSFFSALVIVAVSVAAIADDRARPASFGLDREALTPLPQVEQLRFGALDLEAIAAEDGLRESGGGLLRFAFPHAIDLGTNRVGQFLQTDQFRIQAFLTLIQANIFDDD